MIKDRNPVEIKPCPFCGCNMKAEYKHYPNGTGEWQPCGWHDRDCPLNAVLWCMEEDEGWTKDKLVENWNARWNDS